MGGGGSGREHTDGRIDLPTRTGPQLNKGLGEDGIVAQHAGKQQTWGFRRGPASGTRWDDGRAREVQISISAPRPMRRISIHLDWRTGCPAHRAQNESGGSHLLGVPLWVAFSRAAPLFSTRRPRRPGIANLYRSGSWPPGPGRLRKTGVLSGPSYSVVLAAGKGGCLCAC